MITFNNSSKEIMLHYKHNFHMNYIQISLILLTTMLEIPVIVTRNAIYTVYMNDNIICMIKFLYSISLNNIPKVSFGIFLLFCVIETKMFILEGSRKYL